MQVERLVSSLKYNKKYQENKIARESLEKAIS